MIERCVDFDFLQTRQHVVGPNGFAFHFFNEPDEGGTDAARKLLRHKSRAVHNRVRLLRRSVVFVRHYTAFPSGVTTSYVRCATMSPISGPRQCGLIHKRRRSARSGP